jgi:hypothetical protein
MPTTTYRGRRAVSIENDVIRVTVSEEGGHFAELLHKKSGINPLWAPPWPSMEPSQFVAARDTQYGTDAEAQLLCGILGHNLCLDMFGAPSAEEAAAGMTVHGEASLLPYEVESSERMLIARLRMPAAQIAFERRMLLDGHWVQIRERVENLSALDRPIAWTQHVTLGPPFVVPGETLFEAPVVEWQDYPGLGHVELARMSGETPSGGYTAHLLDQKREKAYFRAFTPSLGLLCGYEWKTADFPWLGCWEENCSRTNPPWNGKAVTRGMEFGVSPMPETRRQMIDRGSMFGVPGYRWLPAKGVLVAEYAAMVGTREELGVSGASHLSGK